MTLPLRRCSIRCSWRATVDVLANSGRALEFGIGTGLVARPRAVHGVAMHGIDIAEEILERSRAKSGSQLMTSFSGDFASTRVPGSI